MLHVADRLLFSATRAHRIAVRRGVQQLARRARAWRTQPSMELLYDGATVWLNVSGGSVARFCRRGVDIHHPPVVQAETGKQCLECVDCPTGTTLADWRLFVALVCKHYKFAVPDAAMPERLRPPVDLDFNLFPSVPAQPAPASRRKAGPLGTSRDDAAVADRDNSRARRGRRAA